MMIRDDDTRTKSSLLGRMHREQNGAVALLALAGSLIIFMTALVMYDTGLSSNEKYRAQMSADAASFTLASVKARSMNTIAYMNVVKRSLSAMFEMYVGMMYAFRLDIQETLECIMTQTEELADWNERANEYEREVARWRSECGNDGGKGKGGRGGPGNKKHAGFEEKDCDPDDAPKEPIAPATEACPGCELVPREEPLTAADIADTLGGLDAFGFSSGGLGGLIEGFSKMFTALTMEQSCSELDLFEAEANFDWQMFALTDPRTITPPPYGTYDDAYFGTVTHFVRVNLQSLNVMQDLLAALTPNWAEAESKQRGLGSGAHMVVNADPQPLPLERGDPMELCMGADGHVYPTVRSGPAVRDELQGNKANHMYRSEAGSTWSSDESRSDRGMQHMERLGCIAAQNNINQEPWAAFFAFLWGGGAVSGGYMEPYHMTEDRIFDMIETERYSKLTDGTARSKFDFMNQEYGGGGEIRNVDAFRGISCGEAFSMDPRYGMWRASWAPRVAPVRECDSEKSMYWK